jgi:MoaA/NifB/PqqE/SkfB family radical SAM enzyme
VRTRREEKSNYACVFVDGKTLRFAIDPNKEIKELVYPEFYDVAINNKCAGGCYKYCYTSATTSGKNFPNVVEKIEEFFGSMSENERPLQVALGGAGEPTLHPDFVEVLKAFVKLGIVPNYTTNAMHLSQKVIDATKEFCGGVAITCHEHLEKFWRKGAELCHQNGIKTNFHFVVSDKQSIDTLDGIYKSMKDICDYFVVLPYMNVGFASGNNSKNIDYEYLSQWIEKVIEDRKLAFGANLFEFLLQKPEYNVSLYPPERMSKYIILDDPIKIYNNSFEMREVKTQHQIKLCQ